MEDIEMNNDFPGGVWPTMITPFTDSNTIDYNALESMIEWYIKNKVDGLFAVCQSSEMFFLSLRERAELARFVKKATNGRIPVIASGHVSNALEDQIVEIKAIAETGVDAVILITNRFSLPVESDEITKRNLEKVLKALDSKIPLGFYECPFPYKRIISPELLNWCASTGRFYFLKDTSCDIKNIKAKIASVKGTPLKIYNANAATLLQSLKEGAAGYSGVMANFHPDLYAWLIKNWKERPEEAEKLHCFLSVASQIEKQIYPVNAKYNMRLEGIKIGLKTRSKDHYDFSDTNKLEIEHLHELSKLYSGRCIYNGID